MDGDDMQCKPKANHHWDGLYTVAKELYITTRLIKEEWK